MSTNTKDIELLPLDNNRLAAVCGLCDSHIRQIERRLGIEINNRGNRFRLIGSADAVQTGAMVLEKLYKNAVVDPPTPEQIHLILSTIDVGSKVSESNTTPDTVIKTRKGLVRPRGINQQEYLHRILTHDINFGVGPAGTGKTYLAVACAVEALERDTAKRLVLVRPAVEAGERLGFLPGDLAQKIDPYLRPLYDALHEMLGFEKVNKLIERNVIELAPLAYMRGRTLNQAFIILDEAQNTTPEQMKMFLTRIGFGSTAVITGDVTQVDLPRGQTSGLRQAIEILSNISDISFTFFNARDVVRHALVQKIVQAYEQHGSVNS
ncbi:PhoH [Achromatium sp. WMS2]|nr:PhoH [Achromatium sp. WMS2]